MYAEISAPVQRGQFISEGPKPRLHSHPLRQAAFLTENWRKSLHLSPPERRRIKIQQGVANLCSKDTLIRTELPGYQDGFYLIAADGSLVGVQPSFSFNFPDPDDAKPDMKDMTSSKYPVENEGISRILAFVEEVRQSSRNAGYSGQEIVIDAQGFYAKYNSSLHLGSPFPLPFTGDGVHVMADSLKVVLTECLRYGQIYIATENNPDKNTGVFFGVDWNHSAIIWPTFHSRKI